MLFRKIEKTLKDHFASECNKIMVVDGARQVGKSFIIRHVGRELFENYIEINFVEDSLQDKRFENVRTIQDFYFQVSMIAGDKMKEKLNSGE